jgi:hypothetical protein
VEGEAGGEEAGRSTEKRRREMEGGERQTHGGDRAYAHMYLELANWESLPVEENTMSATSASQRTESSSAFLKSPRRRLENVTCRAAALSILFISRRSLAIPAAARADILPLPTHSTQTKTPRGEVGKNGARSSEPTTGDGGCVMRKGRGRGRSGSRDEDLFLLGRSA